MRFFRLVLYGLIAGVALHWIGPMIESGLFTSGNGEATPQAKP